MSVSAGTKSLVRARAANRCEYCHLHQSDSPLAVLHVEHIIPKKHGGSDDDENLALACIDCNLHKGPNLTGFDPESGKLTALFHPRRQVWTEHFDWVGLLIVGKTAVGRTTVAVFNMNSDDQLALRSGNELN
ncbi:HNH endonuclease [Anatilimnocola aggregata]|uniref:HNH endonuclease n=1 Tax=Anatilimnocola aggregata TaxID=2528021 RepID=A0A517YIY1_9BACT|nr:HNH endonuclease signature motif containing protein [Anatilimnocola aggregata]QDU30179.1 HNH endonuclease [Anatilimnocola aggregata]